MKSLKRSFEWMGSPQALILALFLLLTSAFLGGFSLGAGTWKYEWTGMIQR